MMTLVIHILGLMKGLVILFFLLVGLYLFSKFQFDEVRAEKFIIKCRLLFLSKHFCMLISL